MEYKMHDWTLKRIEFDWPAARVIIELGDSACTVRSLIAEGVQELRVPQSNEWGPSVSINEVQEIVPVFPGLHQLKIEMQSGDVIKIVARRFVLP